MCSLLQLAVTSLTMLLARLSQLLLSLRTAVALASEGRQADSEGARDILKYSSVSKLQPFSSGRSPTVPTDRALRPSCSRYIRATVEGPGRLRP